jgi:2-polyprenyl-3-methyl-5-hydroxy-6-metoxy-1,4-benzoquinol methylase
VNKHQEYEQDWWGTCSNTYGEEERQLLYAQKMGLKFFHNGKSPYNIDMQGRSVIDIGGGPASLLLKCSNLRVGQVIDPCAYPFWVRARYIEQKIIVSEHPAEQESCQRADEVWCYNVLQHVNDPAKVIENMRNYGKLIRIFEWIETRPTLGHPHTLTKEFLDKHLKGDGKVEYLSLPILKGKCYYGIFPTGG